MEEFALKLMENIKFRAKKLKELQAGLKHRKSFLNTL
jgi:hypothetical protein